MLSSIWQNIKSHLGLHKTSLLHIDQLEKDLLQADFGTKLTTAILNEWKNRLSYINDHNENNLYLVFSELLKEIMNTKKHNIEKGDFISIWGINGVGKTTTCAKLAYYLQKKGSTVMLAACDTYRAAASEQLSIWANQLSIKCIKHPSNTDPASVAFDALQSQKSNNIDFCIADTAGRMHNNNLLQKQSEKIIKVLKKISPSAPEHRWIVLDSHLGQNSINQVKEFNKYVDINGIIITKWDSEAKAGFLAQIIYEYKIPVYFIGIGEKKEDLIEFNIDQFIQKIWSK